MTHRLNVSVTGLEASSGVHYVPKWTELAITLAIVAAGFAVFRLAAHYLPVFEAEAEEDEETRGTGPARALEGVAVRGD